MNKILRWIAYAIVAISAILIIWSLVASCFHHSYYHEMNKKEMGYMKHHPRCVGDSAKMDSIHCKYHEQYGHQMAKKEMGYMKHHPKCVGDSAKMDSIHCKYHEHYGHQMAKQCPVAGECHARYSHMEKWGPRDQCSCHMHHSYNLMNIASTLLLLAIALLIISRNCCCNCKNGTEDKKEA